MDTYIDVVSGEVTSTTTRSTVRRKTVAENRAASENGLDGIELRPDLDEHAPQMTPTSGRLSAAAPLVDAESRPLPLFCALAAAVMSLKPG